MATKRCLKKPCSSSRKMVLEGEILEGQKYLRLDFKSGLLSGASAPETMTFGEPITAVTYKIGEFTKGIIHECAGMAQIILDAEEEGHFGPAWEMAVEDMRTLTTNTFSEPDL